MKLNYKIKNILKVSLALTAFTIISYSCEDNKFFDYEVIASFKDGIQNGDEEGVDCGGSTGVACPSHTDGIQNLDETGIDCGGSSGVECRKDTPRFDALTGTGLPFFHTFELEDSSEGVALTDDNSVTIDFAFPDPVAGSIEIVGRYNRPEGLVADGYSDYKFDKFAAPLDFSTYNKFNLSVYMPSSNDYGNPTTFTPTVEIIFLDSTNPTFWNTWTVLSKEIDAANYDSWVQLGFDGGSGLATATIYDTIAIRIGGSNHTTGATFYVKDFIPTDSLLLPVQDGTPRADALQGTGLSFYHTFEAENATENLETPELVNSQEITFGAPDPGVSVNGVGKIIRPEGFIADGYSDYKFKKFESPLDFSTYTKFQIEFWAPSSNDYSQDGNFAPQIELIFLDSTNGTFWNTWTVLSTTLDEATELDSWQTITFDGSATLPPTGGVNYDTVTIRVGGSNHQIGGTFYIKDFKSIN